LWDARDRLRPHREPEIHRVDLSAPLLSILAWGAEPQTFEWFDRPGDDRIAAAMSLLSRLGAVEHGRLTAVGRLLQRIPLHPRLARVLLAAHGSFEGCAACAWLSEPAAIERQPATTSDLLPILDRWQQMPRHLRDTAQNLQQLARAVLGEGFRDRIDEIDFRRALLAGYPDRVARRRPQTAQMAQHEYKVTLATGHGAVIARESGVHDGEWLIALDVTSGRASLRLRSGQAATTQALVRLASRIEPEWLTPTRSELRVELDRESGAVKAHAVDWYEEVMLREHPVAVPAADRARVLADAWVSRGPDEHSRRLIRRLRFAGADVDLRATIAAAATDARRLDEVVLSEGHLPWDIRQKLTRDAPADLTVPSGRAMPIDYAEDGSVSVSVKLQELFGLAETPRIGPVKTPITFHLLAPNARPVQTTQDLKSFWERTYPEVRKELRGRYPRHPWPEDPWTAPATHRTRKRGSQ
jgi:ATP-dependent helicase HrpB